MSLAAEIIPLFDTYIELCYDSIPPTIDNCGVLLLDTTADKAEANKLLGRIRTMMTRKYNNAYWKQEGVPRPSVFNKEVEDLGWKFYLTKGVRSSD